METALAESEKNYRTLFENNPVGLYRTSADGRVLDANPALVKMFGFPDTESILAMNASDLYTDTDHSAEFNSAIERGDIVANFESEFRRRDGTTFWAEDNVRVIHDDKGSVLFYEGSLTDITQRKQAEEAIRRRDKILSATTFAAEKFLKSSDWRGIIQDVLAQLGAGAEVSRVYVFENHTAPDGTLLTSQRFEWVGEGIAPQIDNPDLQNLPLLASGFSRWVETMERGETIHGQIREFPDVEREILQAQDIQSILIVPIFVRAKWWGFVGFDICLTEREWLLLEIDALKTAADTLGAAIQDEQAGRALERKADELQTLYLTSLEVNAQVDLDSLLRAIVQRAASLVRVESGGLYLMPLDGQNLKLEVGHNLSEQYLGTTLKLGEGLSGKAAQSGEIMVVEDYQEWDGRVRLFDDTSFRRALGVPLKVKGKVIGVLNVIDLTRPGSFSEEDIRLVSLFADQAALAIENVRLFDNAQRRLRQTTALREIDQAIAGSMHVKKVIEIVLKHTLNELGIDAAVVLLFDPREQMLKYELGSGFRTGALKFTHLRLGEGYAGRVALGRQTTYIPDLQTRHTDFLRSPTFHEEGFVCYFGVPLIAKGEIKGVLEIFHRAPLNSDIEWLGFMETLAGQVAIAIDNATLYRDLQRSNVELSLAYDATIEGWSRALDLRDKETEGHTQRVTKLTLAMAREMGMSEEKLVHIKRGALLHDIGKMGIPDLILFKPDKLTDEEWDLMRKHPVFAYEMFKPITFLEPALDIPYCHHEKWDGTGYPRGLKGEDIPLAARIFAVIDVYDALTSNRPYRSAWSKEETLQYIQEQSGTHFDPKIVEAFLKIQATEK